jgi:hypothetical protein
MAVFRSDKETINGLRRLIDRLQLENKILTDRINAYESDSRYEKLREDYEDLLREKDREIQKLKREMDILRGEARKIKKIWMQVNEDVNDEKDKAQAAADMALEKADELKQELRDTRHELYEKTTELFEAENKVKELDARIKKDYTDSSKPSSQSPDHPTIPNGRVKTGKNPGGQKGHIHNGRRMYEPDSIVKVDPPLAFLDTDRYKPTGHSISKQLVQLFVTTQVTEFRTPEFRDIITGQRVHADFPGELKDEVTYDGSVKAFAYLINNDLNVSVAKTKGFIEDVTDGRLELSTGFICGLAKEFSDKTEAERGEIFNGLLSSTYMNADFTFGRMNGKQTTVLVCVSGDKILYQGRAKKGAEGIAGSPVPLYLGTIVSDHERVFLDKGTRHQECLAHVKRYSKGAAEMEPDRKWPVKMQEWISRAIHERNESVSEGLEKVKNAETLEQEFRSILEEAKEEYEYEPPEDNLKDGYNLFKRMYETPDDYVLFLHDITIPPTNNDAERAGRKFKRKASQVMAFRSQEGVDNYCNGLTVIQSQKSQGLNVFNEISEIFRRPAPQKKSSESETDEK